MPESYESSCLGACVLGLKAIGKLMTSIIEEMVGTTNAHQPNQNTVAIYQELVKIFINISRSITESYSEIANFQRKHISN